MMAKWGETMESLLLNELVSDCFDFIDDVYLIPLLCSM